MPVRPDPPSAWQRLKRAFGQPGGPAAHAKGRLSKPGRLADYVPQQLVSRHQRAAIYRATEAATGRVVALKVVRIAPSASSAADRHLWRERFLRETAAAARVRHEAIVQVLAGGVEDDEGELTGWLAMEWAHGADLSRYAHPARLLPEAVVLDIAARVAAGLEMAHRGGIVHRDIKPSNILFDAATGAVRIVDFGSARVADTAATRSGLIIGSPAYMAPEQLAGADPTPASDLYSLGVVLFELLVGRRPFGGDSMGDLLRQIAHQTPPRLQPLRPDLPPVLDDTLARLLAKAPECRVPTAAALVSALRQAQRQCLPATPGTPAARWMTTPIDGAGAVALQGTIADSKERPSGPGRPPSSP